MSSFTYANIIQCGMVFDEIMKGLVILFGEYIEGMKKIRKEFTDFGFGFPQFKCFVCKNKVCRPVMLKTECCCPVFFCKDCVCRFGDRSSCPKCHNPTIQNLFETQELLEEFNDHLPEPARFLSSVCHKCELDCKYQKDLREHSLKETCETFVRVGPIFTEPFEHVCAICSSQLAIPTRYVTQCKCQIYCCLSCMRDALRMHITRCFTCRQPFKDFVCMSKKYYKQRGFMILDDWFRKSGKPHFLSSKCACDEEFGSQIELLQHKLQGCPEGHIRCPICRVEMQRKALKTHDCV